MGWVNARINSYQKGILLARNIQAVCDISSHGAPQMVYDFLPAFTAITVGGHALGGHALGPNCLAGESFGNGRDRALLAVSPCKE